MVQPAGDATPREAQNQSTEGAAAESKKVPSPGKVVREKKRSIFKKPIQMPGRATLLGASHGEDMFTIRSVLIPLIHFRYEQYRISADIDPI